jgi:N-acetylglucosaminyldiphosphoundecaprenol N-acetyl-beta-D-mannosaminyltransferase
MEKLAEKGISLYLLGAKPGVAQRAAERLRECYPGLVICGTGDGYFTDSTAVVEDLRRAKAQVVFVCLGAPKQEQWMAEYGPQSGASLMLGLGGALDVFSGDVQRAPEAWQKLGLEWCYRLLHQPSRIGRMAKLPLFLLTAMKARGKGRS